MQEQRGGDDGEVVGRYETQESARVQNRERHGVAMSGGDGADEEAVLADQGVDAQGVLGGVVVRR